MARLALDRWRAALPAVAGLLGGLTLLSSAGIAHGLLVPVLATLGTAALVCAAASTTGHYRDRALRDPETGLPNLVALAKAAAGRDTFNIIVARIDRYAATTGDLPPAAAMALLLRVADRLRLANAERDIFRTEDACLAWIEGPADEPSLEDRIDAVSAVMRQPIDCGRPVDVLLTFGLAGGGGHEPRQLVAHAGSAAIQAAEKGMRWCRFTAEDSAATSWRLSLLGELDNALATGQVWNAYQPKLDLGSGAIVGAEALVRWHHPRRGPIEPDAFVPVVEANGRVRDLTVHVLAQAIEDAMHWSEAGFPIGVAVNVSAALLADHEFIEMVAQTLQGNNVPAGRVTIEVGESAATDNPERAIAALQSWRRHGLNIAIDDYGTGQSSLGHLQKLPATELKVDKSFVRTIATDPGNATLVRSTIALAHELGMKVVAEGIEDAECLQLLRDMRCDAGQGYHIGRPMSADALLDFLTERPRVAA